ncbi:hypothetical protein ABE41_016060 [Fictibacillus arsenicus]|uniref:Uncharacterized protein n=1 Tax=Fictibacillus arsenicus TaxID=255247 RepID=A0A1B1Z7Z5_9BACL|nr:hypothetical protein ABE41_016060 [Fictibacillus arsenicus]
MLKNKTKEAGVFLKKHYLMLTLLLIYFLWNLFAQNVEKPRHSFPITLMLLFIWLVSIAGKHTLLKWACMGLTVMQLVIGIPILKEQTEKIRLSTSLQTISLKKMKSLLYTLGKKLVSFSTWMFLLNTRGFIRMICFYRTRSTIKIRRYM